MLLSDRTWEGFTVGRELALVCAQAGVQKASGTTDVDAICYELEVMLLRKQVNTMIADLANLLYKIVFLRVHARRFLKGALPTIAHHQTTLGVLVLQVQQFLLLVRSPEHLALTIRRWSSAQVTANEETRSEAE